MTRWQLVQLAAKCLAVKRCLRVVPRNQQAFLKITTLESLWFALGGVEVMQTVADRQNVYCEPVRFMSSRSAWAAVVHLWQVPGIQLKSPQAPPDRFVGWNALLHVRSVDNQ